MKKRSSIFIAIIAILALIFPRYTYAGNSGIVINEIYPNPVGDEATNGEREWVEIYNTSDQTINLSGWYLTNKSNQQVPISQQGELGPHGFGVIYGHGDWLKNDQPEKITLYNQSNLSEDEYSLPDSNTENIVFGRYPDGSNNWQILPSATLGYENNQPLITPTQTPTPTVITSTKAPKKTSDPPSSTPTPTIASTTANISNQNPTPDSVSNVQKIRQQIKDQEAQTQAKQKAQIKKNAQESSKPTIPNNRLTLILIFSGLFLLLPAGTPMILNQFKKPKKSSPKTLVKKL